MKKKIWMTVGVIAVIGWLIPICLVLRSEYKAHIAKHQAEIVKHREEAFVQGASALHNRMVQELKAQDSLRIIIDGEERTLKLEKQNKRKR